MFILSIFSAGLLATYSAFILLLARGLKMLSRSGRQGNAGNGNISELTIIIPFRNEERTLPFLLQDLLEQDVRNLKVVLVNDHSTDGSVPVVEKRIADCPGYSLLHLPKEKQGKKDALAMGVSESDSEWILQVDADCRVGPAFVSSHLACAAACSADLVAGAVSTASVKGGFLEAFERNDVLSLTASGAGSFYYGRPLMCSGANLMYRRELYLETRSFDHSGTASGDDMFLLIGARRLERNCSFNADPSSLVLTPARTTWRDLLRQRMRWGAKTSHYGMPDIQVAALLVALANLAFAAIPLLTIFHSGHVDFLLLAAGIKMLADFVLIRRMAGISTQQRSLRWYIPVALLHPFYTVLIVIALPFRGRSWD